MKTRLETISRLLVDKFSEAPASKQRAASLLACELAVAESNIVDPLVTEALSELREDKVLSASRIAELESLAERLDLEYFESQADDRDPTNEWMRIFAKARAVAAVAFAGSSDPCVSGMEAIYEAGSACSMNDVEKAVQLILE